MTQTGLIDRIITAMGLDDTNGKDTPAICATLPKDKDGKECNADFNYASVLGMLLYLQGHTRPDISFAVNQCARYTFSPRRSHEEAMKHIGRYLKSTRDKGIIMTPTEKLQLDCFVDADFAGLWNYEKDIDPTSVKSRSGFLFMLGGCPISWVSRLQSEIALSTMESEYVAMSVSMKYQPEFCYQHRTKEYSGCEHPNDLWRSSLTIHGIWPQVSLFVTSSINLKSYSAFHVI